MYYYDLYLDRVDVKMYHYYHRIHSTNWLRLLQQIHVFSPFSNELENSEMMICDHLHECLMIDHESHFEKENNKKIVLLCNKPNWHYVKTSRKYYPCLYPIGNKIKCWPNIFYWKLVEVNSIEIDGSMS